MVKSNKNEGQEDIDSEMGLTAERLMTAIRRVLQSIHGKFPELYPTLEGILEESIYLCFADDSHGGDYIEEGITCISELLYNQSTISERMWKLYFHMMGLYISDAGVLDEYLAQISVPIINYMTKAPNEFKHANFTGQGTPLDLLFQFITKVFKDGTELEDEILSMNAVALIMAILEHLGDGINQHLHTINQFYITEIQKARTGEYKSMIIQGIMMNFNYDQETTIASL